MKKKNENKNFWKQKFEKKNWKKIGKKRKENWAIYKKVIFTQKKKKMAKISKTGIFFKKGFRVNLMVSNFMQNIKTNLISQYWANNIQKSWFYPTAPPTFATFCPFSGQKGIFTEKWQHCLKRLMVFYLYAKKIRTRKN